MTASHRLLIPVPHANWGGPVFPQECDLGGGAKMSCLGMSLRDYFIAHAPAEPQAWFNPVMDRDCPVVPSVDNLTREQRDDLEREWEASEGSPWARQWLADRAAAERAQEQWQADFRKEWVLQWPAAWADEMLKRRGKP